MWGSGYSRINRWQSVTVSNILTNEIYRGSKRLQKTFCTYYLKRYDELNELIERLEKEKSDRITRSQVIKRFIKRISKESIISSFDVDLWSASVENVTVGVDGKLTFKFKNGAEIVK